MNNPLVSIVCIAFNQEQYIRQALEGFIKQKTTFPFEVLVNDDCSTDGTADIIREYEAKYPDLFRCVYQSENQYSKGVHPWFDVLFPMARGKYIALCEGDDYWTDPYKLQKQVDFLENNMNYTACFHNAKIGNDGNYRFFNSANENNNPHTEDIVKRRWFISTQSLVFRNINLVFPEWTKKVVSTDYLLELLLAREGEFYYMDDVMSVYRKHEGSVSFDLNKKQVQMYDQLILLLTNMKELYDGKYSCVFDESIANYKAQKDDFIKSTHPIGKWFYGKTYTRFLKKMLRGIAH